MGDRAGVAAFRILSPESAVEPNAIERAIDHCFHFVRILYLASLGQPTLGFRRTEPGGMAHRFFRSAQFVDFHQESLHHKFLHATRLPEHALGMNIEMEVARLDGAQSARFFYRLAPGCPPL